MPASSVLSQSSKSTLHCPACGIKAGPCKDFSLARWPKVKLCQWRKLKGHCRGRGSLPDYTFLSFLLGPVLPVLCGTHPKEFQQPPYGSFPVRSTGATTSFPERPAMKRLPSKFNNTPSDSFQTNSTSTQSFITTLADGFLLASPRLLPLAEFFTIQWAIETLSTEIWLSACGRG